LRERDGRMEDGAEEEEEEEEEEERGYACLGGLSKG